MAEWNVSEDQGYNCAVCLEILKNPVAINCGHNFCMTCINSYWDQHNQTGVFSCPQCRETFTPRPVLRKNNLLAEMVEKLQISVSLSDHVAGPGEAECDYCTGRKHKAIKSCLVCMISLCETHLKPHEEVPALKRHKLINAVSQLQEMICTEHDKLMEIYCRTDQCCICYLCTVDKHKGHETVSVVAERNQKQDQVKEAQKNWERLIQEKEKKNEELQQTLKKIKNSSDDAVKESEKRFSMMISFLQTKRSEVTDLIRAQEKSELTEGEKLLKQMDQEISDLKKRHSDLEELSETQDHVHFLKSYSSLCSSAASKTSSITLNQYFSFCEVKNAVSDLKKQVEELLKREFNKIPAAIKRTSLLQTAGKKKQWSRLQSLGNEPEPSKKLMWSQLLSHKNEMEPSEEEIQSHLQSLKHEPELNDEVKLHSQELKHETQLSGDDEEQLHLPSWTFEIDPMKLRRKKQQCQKKRHSRSMFD